MWEILTKLLRPRNISNIVTSTVCFNTRSLALDQEAGIGPPNFRSFHSLMGSALGRARCVDRTHVKAENGGKRKKKKTEAKRALFLLFFMNGDVGFFLEFLACLFGYGKRPHLVKNSQQLLGPSSH
jgi:hypothetical protein